MGPLLIPESQACSNEASCPCFWPGCPGELSVPVIMSLCQPHSWPCSLGRASIQSVLNKG